MAFLHVIRPCGHAPAILVYNSELPAVISKLDQEGAEYERIDGINTVRLTSGAELTVGMGTSLIILEDSRGNPVIDPQVAALLKGTSNPVST